MVAISASAVNLSLVPIANFSQTCAAPIHATITVFVHLFLPLRAVTHAHASLATQEYAASQLRTCARPHHAKTTENAFQGSTSTTAHAWQAIRVRIARRP